MKAASRLLVVVALAALAAVVLLLEKLAPALLAGTGVARRDLIAAIGSVDRAVAGLPLPLQDEVRQLLALLAFWPGRRWVAGVAVPWREASIAEVSAFLERWRGGA